ncbi:cephalosporin-C deacetylase [Hamadaea flava]|uniref:Acetylxylan esterase n=1 Tax=Hamadaea flava TaxID=1742688 RepID=A0ABV8LPN9_9ACTN|nr:acetylxylan esterase [Hamadaea flava]MCP2322973.1 cephalosporin-C deacetylase [Hamadaea flava]
MALFDLPLDQLRRYAPEVPEPADFAEFWATTLGSAAAKPVLIDVRPEPSDLALIDCWDVTFAGFGGDPIRAWYSRPAGRSEALPAVVEFLGYGRGRGLPHERPTYAAAGYAHLLMDSRGQGGQYGTGGDTPDPGGSAYGGPGPVTRGLLDPAEYYYRRLITDAVRAVEAVRALPGVDPSRVAVAGNSQGGGLALAVAGLVADLSAVLSTAPFLCHVQRAIDITDAEPYAEIVRFLAIHREAEDDVRRTLSYMDGVAFARRATAPAQFGVGLRDTVCPPSTVFAAANQYAAEHEVQVYPFNHHEGGEAVHVRRQLRWLCSKLS